MSTANTLLDIFAPPEGLVGHSAALVAMTGAEDFLEAALQRFCGLRPRQRAELGATLAYLMLDGHESAPRTAVVPPGRVPALHEFHPKKVAPGSLLHAKLALLAFSSSRTGGPVHLRLAVLTANFTYTSARQQLELVWVIDVPLDGRAKAVDRAEVSAAGAFVEVLLEHRFYRDERALPKKDRRLTARLDDLLATAAGVAPANPRPRFIHSVEVPLYAQIRSRFRSEVDSPRNLLLCGSGFYEEPSGKAAKPEVLAKLEGLGVLTENARRVAVVEPGEAGAIADWRTDGETDGWEIVTPIDPRGLNRKLHAKFIYAGYLRDGHASNGWLYLGSGNLSRRGLLTAGVMPRGNIECGVIISATERLDGEALESALFWNPDAEAAECEKWEPGQVGDEPETSQLLDAPPILSAAVVAEPERALRLLWREDAHSKGRVAISWIGHGWIPVKYRQEDVPLHEVNEPTALNVRDSKTGAEWTIPVVDASGRVSWQPPRFTSYADALAALLDFPIRPAEATDDDGDGDDDGGNGHAPPGLKNEEDEKSYALHAAAELVERVAALQVALPEPMLDDWLEHLDRMFRGAFPEILISAWREHRIDIFAHLREPELRSPKLTDRQRSRYFELLDRSARAWGLR
ncbi:MAG: hypothetical protein ACRD1X_06060 [Vicinamibacteria bacterium]